MRSCSTSYIHTLSLSLGLLSEAVCLCIHIYIHTYTHTLGLLSEALLCVRSYGRVSGRAAQCLPAVRSRTCVDAWTLDFGVVCFVVTKSSTGPRNRFNQSQVEECRPRRRSWPRFPLTRSCPELLRVTGPLLSIELRIEDVWQKYNHCIEVCGALNQGFPFSPLQWRPMIVPCGD